VLGRRPTWHVGRSRRGAAVPARRADDVGAFGGAVAGPGDRRPVHLFGARQVIWLQANGDRAYVDLTASSDWFTSGDPLATDRVVGVIDLDTGRVLTEWRGRPPKLLVGGCCDEPTG
jgi:hypothetical protein